MRFGTREKTTNLGSFTSDKCRSCKNGRFRMDKKVKYIVGFGARTVAVRVRYASVCERCGAEEPVANVTARGLARKYFRRSQLRQQFFMALRALIVAAIVAAIVILPLTVRIPLSRDAETIKSLVSTDGDYAIRDSEGELIAVINVTGGVKTITWYDQVSELADTGSKGGRFYLHETYKEATDSAGSTAMIRDQDDPGALMDQYGSVVRVYYYDEASGALAFNRGVEDLSKITYSRLKVTYPCVYHISEDESQNYLMVLYIKSNARVRAQYAMSASTGAYDQLVTVSIEMMSGSRKTDEITYSFGAETIAAAAQAGLTPDSEAQDYVDFIDNNAVEAVSTYHYDYYGNTNVVAAETDTYPHENGNMQTQTITYAVTVNRGYYIVQVVDSTG